MAKDFKIGSATEAVDLSVVNGDIKSNGTKVSLEGHTHGKDDITNLPVLLITEGMVTVTTDTTKGVAPYSTSYGYTNITVNDLTEADLFEGLAILPLAVSKMVVVSAYRNVRIRFGESGAWHPVMHASSILAGYSYFTANNQRLYVYRTSVRSEGAFHMVNDTNSTYSTYSLGIGYGVCTTAEDTIAKTATHASYSLVVGGINAVKFTYGVPASATLNVNSKGAKPIYYKGAAIAAGVINAGDIATFVYTTTPISTGCYELLTINTWGENPTWDEVSGKPDTFPPSTHNHDTLYAKYTHGHTVITDSDGYVKIQGGSILAKDDNENLEGRLAFVSEIPAEVTESTVSGWGFTKTASVNNITPDESGNISLPVNTPIKSKTFTYTWSGENDDDGKLVFAKVYNDRSGVPIKDWQIHYLLEVVMNTSSYRGYYDVKINYSHGTTTYYICNNFHETTYPITKHGLYRQKAADTLSTNIGGGIGVDLNDATNPTEKRYYTLYILEEYRCKIDFLDDIETHSSFYTESSTANYLQYDSFDATKLGFQETGDEDTIPEHPKSDWEATSGDAVILNKPFGINEYASLKPGINSISATSSEAIYKVDFDFSSIAVLDSIYFGTDQTVSTHEFTRTKYAADADTVIFGSSNYPIKVTFYNSLQTGSSGDYNILASSGTGQANIIYIDFESPTIKKLDETFLPDVASNWNENESTSLKYVENRPFYDFSGSTILDASKDGFRINDDTTGYLVDFGFDYIAELESVYYASSYDGIATSDNAAAFAGVGDETIVFSYPGASIAVIFYKNIQTNSDEQKYNVSVKANSNAYPRNSFCIKFENSYIKKLDEKFLNTFTFRLSVNGGDIVSDKTVEEIGSAIDSGYVVQANLLGVATLSNARVDTFTIDDASYTGIVLTGTAYNTDIKIKGCNDDYGDHWIIEPIEESSSSSSSTANILYVTIEETDDGYSVALYDFADNSIETVADFSNHFQGYFSSDEQGKFINTVLLDRDNDTSTEHIYRFYQDSWTDDDGACIVFTCSTQDKLKKVTVNCGDGEDETEISCTYSEVDLGKSARIVSWTAADITTT